MSSALNTSAEAEIDLEAVARLQDACRRITSELAHVVVGQDRVIRELLLAILSEGHCLLVGVPGLAKTLMVRSVAETLGLSFNRIQFTPDLMPADITGTEVIQEDRAAGTRELRFLKGPVFANVVLADEINRTPPKTQSALLEAMQEHQVTIGGQRHALPEPFFVLATQNPIEQEGTYPLPEAQRDRFMLDVRIDYPEEEEEFQIVRRTTAGAPGAVAQVVSGEELVFLQQVVRAMPVADHVIRYALTLVRLTRRDKRGAPDYVVRYVNWGAGPRASQNLILGAKANAAMDGRPCAEIEDVNAVAAPVLRHRLITNFNAEADEVSPDDLVQRLIETAAGQASGSTGLSGMFKRA